MRTAGGAGGFEVMVVVVDIKPCCVVDVVVKRGEEESGKEAILGENGSSAMSKGGGRGRGASCPEAAMLGSAYLDRLSLDLDLDLRNKESLLPRPLSDLDSPSWYLDSGYRYIICC